MNKFFKNPSAGTSPLSPRAVLENQYKVARINLLVAIAFTILNIITVTGGTYMLFSVYLPYLLVVIGASWCGMMPADWYEVFGHLYITLKSLEAIDFYGIEECFFCILYTLAASTVTNHDRFPRERLSS